MISLPNDNYPRASSASSFIYPGSRRYYPTLEFSAPQFYGQVSESQGRNLGWADPRFLGESDTYTIVPITSLILGIG
ncbi:uncharacterized protein ARMOST_17199 [Armillaria ostoyae]|uniref:Uncharacterized protein n=1 Tax=Armillaria ostoyae TaxID=47428 RepID=A0A284RYC8_ARMOS|nr:uncharacterized protein ARMOST_17199 [Armillaria ostoyae]